ncbi:MAG: PAS domain S-box protein [Geminicoccaceae bacterium]
MSVPGAGHLATVSGHGESLGEAGVAAPSPSGELSVAPVSALDGLESALLAAIVENSDDAIASKDLTGTVTSWNRAAERLFGYAAAEIVGHPIAVLAAPGRENEMPMILERIRRGEHVDHFETVRRRKDGSLVEIALTVSPIRDQTGRIVGASKIARDISERRRSEAERELRFSELRHRVKNLLAIVSAIAGQTSVEGVSAQEYRSKLTGRLDALAAAHEASFQTDKGTDLRALITRLLTPYIPGAFGERVLIGTGPAVDVPPGRIQALAFVLHELATNAVKHGALSVPEGRLPLAWTVEQAADEERLRLEWRECGGPPVAPPAAQGFGLKLIGFMGPDLGGGAELEFDPRGLAVRITLRLS